MKLKHIIVSITAWYRLKCVCTYETEQVGMIYDSFGKQLDPVIKSNFPEFACAIDSAKPNNALGTCWEWLQLAAMASWKAPLTDGDAELRLRNWLSINRLGNVTTPLDWLQDIVSIQMRDFVRSYVGRVATFLELFYMCKSSQWRWHS